MSADPQSLLCQVCGRELAQVRRRGGSRKIRVLVLDIGAGREVVLRAGSIRCACGRVREWALGGDPPGEERQRPPA
jgi:hypothetical protein